MADQGNILQSIVICLKLIRNICLLIFTFDERFAMLVDEEYASRKSNRLSRLIRSDDDAKNLLELIHKRRKKSSTIFCSQFRDDEWYERISNDGENPIADAIMDRIAFDSYKINIEPIDPSKDFSMRETYGLRPEDTE